MNHPDASPTKSVAQYRLDLLTFAVSGLRDGLGPLLGVFLIQKTQWDAFQVSTVLATAGITNLLLQIPTGFLYDTRTSSFFLVGLGAVCLASSCLIVSLVPPFLVAVISQILVGVGSCLLSVGLPALSLQSASFSDLRKRLARNEIFSKLGNFCSIGTMGYVSQKFNLFSMFYIIYLAAAVLISVCLHGFICDRNDSRSESIPLNTIREKSTFRNFFSTIICNRALWPILVTGFLYQFSNASMFMIFEQQWVRRQVNGGVGYISSSLLLTQLTIVVTSLIFNRSSKAIPIGLSMRVGLTFIAVRGLIFLSGASLLSLFTAQFLDGLIAGILIIIPVSAIAQFAGNKFNRMSAAFGMIVVAAASLSTLSTGYIIAHAGFTLAYGILVAVAIVGLLLTSIFERSGFFNIGVGKSLS